MRVKSSIGVRSYLVPINSDGGNMVENGQSQSFELYSDNSMLMATSQQNSTMDFLFQF